MFFWDTLTDLIDRKTRVFEMHYNSWYKTTSSGIQYGTVQIILQLFLRFSGEFKGLCNPLLQLVVHSAVLLHSDDVTTYLSHGWAAQISSVFTATAALGGEKLAAMADSMPFL